MFQKDKLNWEADGTEWPSVRFAWPTREKLTGRIGAGLFYIENISYD